MHVVFVTVSCPLELMASALFAATAATAALRLFVGLTTHTQAPPLKVFAARLPLDTVSRGDAHGHLVLAGAQQQEEEEQEQEEQGEQQGREVTSPHHCWLQRRESAATIIRVLMVVVQTVLLPLQLLLLQLKQASRQVDVVVVVVAAAGRGVRRLCPCGSLPPPTPVVAQTWHSRLVAAAVGPTTWLAA